MNKPEFHYKSSGRCSEYSFSFELMSIVGRKFFCKSPPFKNGYCNIGCGNRFLKNYVNADFYQFNSLRYLLKKNKLTQKLDWEIDLRYRLNCEDNFFSGIFAEHVIEHLTIHDALNTLKEIKRILRKGGVLRISVPDLKKYIDFYNNKKSHKKFSNWSKLKGESIWCLTHNFGHHSVYDFELLKDLLRNVGFKKILQKRFNESEDSFLKIDDVGRKWESLYVEAIK